VLGSVEAGGKMVVMIAEDSFAFSIGVVAWSVFFGGLVLMWLKTVRGGCNGSASGRLRRRYHLAVGKVIEMCNLPEERTVGERHVFRLLRESESEEEAARALVSRGYNSAADHLEKGAV
jgi:hypothetical protein